MTIRPNVLTAQLRRALLQTAVAALLSARGAAAADANGAGGGEAAQLGNITVTAQSRTQEVQDVPIPVQIVTEKQIESLAATDLSKMNGYIPGLVVGGEQPTQPGYSLRGISVSDFGIGTDSPIGIYEDGVYAGKTGGALLLFNDIQRVEVLKGPQGTLFGRNSAGGAISIVTNEPGYREEATVRARLGNYEERYVDAMVNIPLTSDIAFRLSFVNNHNRGWLRDAATGKNYEKDDDWGSRAQLHWNAPGETEVNFAWEYERLNQPARPAVGLVDLPASPGLPPVPSEDRKST